MSYRRRMADRIATLSMVNLDCDDNSRLAAFYGAVLGWPVTYDDGPYSMISDGSTSIGFGHVDDYAAPPWPDTGAPKRFHLDLGVDDLDAAQAALVELGATVADPQPEGARWRVMLDPAGHPFCIAPRSS